MFVEYDTEIYADESILNIPLVATILPLAWLTGSDLYVETLDKSFKESMEKLQQIFQTMLQLPKYGTKIIVDKIVENQANPVDPDRRTGLLFSGGIDSSYSLITNIDTKPRLIMHWGLDGPPYPIYRDYWEMVQSTYTKYATQNDLTYNLTKTNVLEILNSRKIEHRFSKELYYGSLWVRLQESLVILCLTAPLSIKRFNRLIIAASMYKGSPANTDINRPHSAKPEIDENITWADIKVKHDGFIPRYQKTSKIAEYLKKNDLHLRVCLARPSNQNTPEKMNCNNCSKCYRTIMQLTQAGYDPNKTNFIVDENTFTKIREYYTTHGLDVYGNNSKSIIPEKIEEDIHGSRAFFEWLKNYTPQKGRNLWPYRDIYYSLPWSLAKVLNKVYKMAGINIHNAIPVLPDNIVKRLKT